MLKMKPENWPTFMLCLVFSSCAVHCQIGGVVGFRVLWFFSNSLPFCNTHTQIKMTYPPNWPIELQMILFFYTLQTRNWCDDACLCYSCLPINRKFSPSFWYWFQTHTHTHTHNGSLHNIKFVLGIYAVSVALNIIQ